MTDHRVEDLLRSLAPQVLGALTRRYGHFDVAEDAVQEALLAAAQQWPAGAVPAEPRAWLIRIASRRMIDQLRSDQARRRREDAVADMVPADRRVVPGVDAGEAGAPDDDSLVLLYLCCHPALSPASQAALTLRAVGGLTTAEIARAFLVPERTMGQRISRAKQQVQRSQTGFRLPAAAEREARTAVVLQVLYLVFNEGYVTSSGPVAQRVELSTEAIRLTRMLHRAVPDDGEVTGLLALMLLTDARRSARTGADGELVPLAEQDRSRWDAALVAEGVALVTEAMSQPPPGPYRLQAAIAAVHDEAADAAHTDWVQVLALYSLLEQLGDNPVVTLNRAVALAMVHGPSAGLMALEPLDDDPRLARHHRLDAVRAHLHEQAGDLDAAVAHFRSAARRTTSVPEQRYLRAQVIRLEGRP